MTRAIILGIGGQDGVYLARLLRARGHDVAGTARDVTRARDRLTALGVGDEVVVAAAAEADDLAVYLACNAADELYDLRTAPAGRRALAGLVEALGRLPRPPRLFSAAAAADDIAAIAAAREAGLFAVSGRLFDHASRLAPPGNRAAGFIAAAGAIARGAATEMTLTTPDATRDWGWAPEYVDAMTRMLAAGEPRDYVIATGTALTDRQFAEHALAWFKLDPARHLRVTDDAVPASVAVGDPSAIARDLGWKAYTHGRDLVETLCEGLAAT